MNYLYVVKARSGVVKVGRTRRPEERESAISLALRDMGTTIARIGFTAECDWVSVGEARLLALVKSQGLMLLRGREWFSDGDFDSLMQLAHRACSEANAERAAYLRRPQQQTPAQKRHARLRARFFAEFQKLYPPELGRKQA